ncbi:MAG: hypothetical protein R6U35_07680 [Candidatus Humimicrobiaceae bacterium]
MKLNKKENKGNITILVLVIAVVVILGTASMLGYVFRDIQFTEVGEGKLRAFNFAEAGIANFQSQIISYYNAEIDELPESGYSRQIIKDGEEQGGFTINYEEVYEDDYLIGYTVISKGIDKSGNERTVKAFIDITSGSEINIYDYIYSNSSMNSGEVTASQTAIHGPFYTNGTLNLRGGVSFLDGPLYVYEDIILGGKSSIGEEGSPIDLYLRGSFENVNGSEIDPLNPGHNEDVYVENFSTDVPNLPMVTIDQAYVNDLEDKTYVTGDLSISSDSITGEGLNEDYLYFDDNNILNISGNIIVEGNVQIGTNSGQKKEIAYTGTGKIISKNDTYIYYKLTPGDLDRFPEEDLLLLLSMSNMYLDFGKSAGEPDGVFMAIANNNIKLEESVYFIGSSIAQHLDIDNNSDIYYESGLSDYLPEDLPQSTVGYGSAVIEDWQEIRNE